jgi:hypothetical protein
MITKLILYESPDLCLILLALCFHIYDSFVPPSSRLHKLPWPRKLLYYNIKNSLYIEIIIKIALLNNNMYLLRRVKRFN